MLLWFFFKKNTGSENQVNNQALDILWRNEEMNIVIADWSILLETEM